MMGLIILVAVQIAATLIGFALLWLRLGSVRREVASIRDTLEMLASKRTAAFWTATAQRHEEHAEAKRAAFAGIDVALSKPAANDAPSAEKHRGAPLSAQRLMPSRPLVSIEDQTDEPLARIEQPSVSPDMARAIVITVLLSLPAIGFAFAAPAGAIVSAALMTSSAALLISLRDAWRHTAWFATLGAAAWTLTGMLGQVALTHVDLFTGALAASGIAGLTHARAQRVSAPGVTFTLIMATAAIVLGAQLGVVSAAGISFGIIIAAAAAFGASTLRLEFVHLGAFAAAGLGLYVLSAQQPAGIWFTPAAVWTGMWFLAIAFLRAPMLGQRGTLVAATGAAAPIFAISALYAARHGLETPFAAAGAYFILAAILSATLALAARRAGSLANLHIALWALAIPAIGSAIIAAMLAAPPPLHAAALMAMALCLIALDARYPDRLWRFATVALAAIGVASALMVSQHFGALDTPYQPLWLALFTLATPAAFAGIGAHLIERRAPITAGCLESVAILGGAAFLSAGVRLGFSTGVPALEPISFVEIGAHASLWLFASLALAWRASYGARTVRGVASAILAIAGMTLIFACLVAWLAPWWRAPLEASALHPPLGFALPAVAAWAHWAFWRGRGNERRTRTAFAVAVLLTAAWATFEMALLRSGSTEWVTATLGACLFALAAGLNFVPGLATPKPANAA